MNKKNLLFDYCLSSDKKDLACSQSQVFSGLAWTPPYAHSCQQKLFRNPSNGRETWFKMSPCFQTPNPLVFGHPMPYMKGRFHTGVHGRSRRPQDVGRHQRVRGQLAAILKPFIVSQTGHFKSLIWVDGEQSCGSNK